MNHTASKIAKHDSQHTRFEYKGHSKSWMIIFDVQKNAFLKLSSTAILSSLEGLAGNRNLFAKSNTYWNEVQSIAKPAHISATRNYQNQSHGDNLQTGWENIESSVSKIELRIFFKKKLFWVEYSHAMSWISYTWFFGFRASRGPPEALDNLFYISELLLGSNPDITHICH